MSGPNETVATSIDKVTTPEIRVQSENIPTGTIDELYQAARDVEDGPLSLVGAEKLVSAVDDGDTVLLTVGAGSEPWMPKGETDGPQGTVGLAHALALGLGARPVLVTEERHIPPLEAAAHACGLNNVPYEQLVERKNAVSIVPYPEDYEDAVDEAEKFFSEYEPAAVLAIERLGPNDEGIIPSVTGDDISEGSARMEPLFDKAAEENVLTIGFGDGGNEIGFGKIQDAVREIQPAGDEIATRVAADHVVVGGTSNWGAYGVEAMIAIMTDTPEAMHSPDDESRMLEHSILEGSNDGVYGRPMMMVDGTSEATNRGIVAILNNIVKNQQTQVNRPF